MLNYNTQLKRLKLPEYGRTIQSMVDHCLTIADRDERTQCAYAIVKSMSKVNPSAEKNEESERKLWDHLAIMSDFKLDIDYPFEVVKPEHLDSKPDAVLYISNPIRYRHYGKNIVDMIAVAFDMPEGEERDELVLLIANHMKKTMLAVNRDGVEDEKVFRDLTELSHGSIRLSADTVKLHEFQAAPEPKTGKKKKKK